MLNWGGFGRDDWGFVWEQKRNCWVENWEVDEKQRRRTNAIEEEPNTGISQLVVNAILQDLRVLHIVRLGMGTG